MRFEELAEKFSEDHMDYRALVSSLPLQTVVKFSERAVTERKWILANFLFIEASTKMAKLGLYCLQQWEKDLENGEAI